MSTSTNLTAEQLLELALRTSRTCRERQRRTAVRAEEERARLAALHGRIDELERALNGADAKRAVHADAVRSYASEPCCECRQLREQRDEARAALAVAVAKRSPCCGCAVRCGRCGSEFARTEEEATRIAKAEKSAHVEALSLAETRSAGADVIVADAARSCASSVGLGDTCEPPDVLEAVRGAIAERDALSDAMRITAQSDLLGIESAHSCHDGCGRPACVMRRERDRTQRERDSLVDSIARVVHEAERVVHESEERGARWALDGVARLPDGVPPLVPRWELARRICADARTKGGE